MAEPLPSDMTVDAFLVWAVERPGPLRARTRHRRGPVVVVEVASPSSGNRDHNQKLIGYFMVPSVQHDLIVHPDRRALVHHARRGDEIATRILHGGALRLDPPGLDLRIEDLFGSPSEMDGAGPAT